ncbi:hypothetical protein ACU8KH_00043 [Lachancea thermotolerans]
MKACREFRTKNIKITRGATGFNIAISQYVSDGYATLVVFPNRKDNQFLITLTMKSASLGQSHF